MPLLNRTCETCGKLFVFRDCPSNRRLGRGRFCSKDCQKIWQTVPLEERFFRYIGVPDQNGCVPWIGCTNADGYGIIGSGTQEGHNLLTHRVSFEIHIGSIPNQLNVLHCCDNPPCVNPDHLFLGTNTDNIADMVAKRRQAVGNQLPWSKLDNATALLIRQRYTSEKISQEELAQEYGVHQTVIGKIIRREIWKHV